MTDQGDEIRERMRTKMEGFTDEPVDDATLELAYQLQRVLGALIVTKGVPYTQTLLVGIAVGLDRAR